MRTLPAYSRAAERGRDVGTKHGDREDRLGEGSGQARQLQPEKRPSHWEHAPALPARRLSGAADELEADQPRSQWGCFEIFPPL